MHKPKPYRCTICGAEIPNLPMTVLGHQMSHVKRRPYANDRPSKPDRQVPEQPGKDIHG